MKRVSNDIILYSPVYSIEDLSKLKNSLVYAGNSDIISICKQREVFSAYAGGVTDLIPGVWSRFILRLI